MSSVAVQIFGYPLELDEEPDPCQGDALEDITQPQLHRIKRDADPKVCCMGRWHAAHYLTRAVTSPMSDPGKGVLGLVSCVSCLVSRVSELSGLIQRINWPSASSTSSHEMPWK